MKKTTIKDVAKKAGVSYVTVSKVFNNRGAISEKTAEKIKKIGAELNYTPDRAARALVSGKSETIAVVSPEFASAFTQLLFEGLQESSLKSGKEMNFFATGATGEGLEHIIESIYAEKKAGAVIVISQCPEEAQIKKLKEAGIRVVLIEGKSENAVCISSDNIKGGYEAGMRLLSGKCRRPGIIVGDVKYISSQSERLAGFLKALKEKGVLKNGYETFEIRKHNFQDGKNAFNSFVEKGVDCVFSAAGDVPAYGFLFEARKQRVSGIRIIGFDDAVMSEGMGLTTVKQYVKEMGMAAFDAAAGKENTNLSFVTKLITRETA
ncbi:MAG: hypothetical protein CVV21_00590 [Candidatus Goldiibacteriota bacterium HGW-Goldbacteria-1]|nr:MAG: hypothetical protein CVV21_00590 [Candidatus Goldiibacteriota bacterium HGW-Goldbacteria-1]